ncbi:MAG TPA: FliM/FliN family flagellar motor switch protein [Acidobacteriaceae bacterium]|jgi:flagellar motor switch protein FliN/FliY|nr:FliM/FliN family flagellar motor switch protein [Acidobacteriaceae bacterium]
MSDVRPWISKLEAEIGRELGQPVSSAPGGEAPAPGRSLADTIELPGAHLVVEADRDDVAGFLTEARVIEAGQADAEMVRELWSGILASVATGLGGKTTTWGKPEGMGEPLMLRLGEALLHMAVSVETTELPAKPQAESVASASENAPASAVLPAMRAPGRPAGNFDLLLEVELDASVRFGSREMELKELLELGPGDVVELDRHVADPVDLIVGDRIVARGEVVLVNGNFGLRVTDVAEPVRRLESIRCLW